MDGNKVRSSLLRYRYTKGAFSKFESMSKSSQDTTESSQDSTSSTSGTSSSRSSTSPEPKLSRSDSSKSSPWMSKERGQLLNGTSGKKKQGRLLICGRLSGSDSEEETTPPKKGGKKRQVTEDSEEDSPVMLSLAKKARPLESSQSQADSQEAKADSQETKADSQETKSEESKQTNGDAQAYILTEQEVEMKIAFLRESFPNLSRRELRRVLMEKAGGDCAEAAVILTRQTQTPWTPSCAKVNRVSAVIAPPSPSPSPSSSTADNTSVKPSVKPSVSISSIRAAPAKLLPVKQSKAKDYGSDMDDDEDYDADGTDVDSDDSLEQEGPGSSAAAMILSFFEDATPEELAAIPGGSKKKAEMIMELRPFSTYDNLVAKFEERRALSYNLISGCREMIHQRHIVKNLMKKCEKISEEMSKIITCSMDDSNDSEDRITSQPVILNAEMQLAHYQLVGLNWLRIMHSQELDGILADEMGLGKTVQTIAFLAHLFEQGEMGPHVIIVPPTTVDNWLRELSVWCPALKVELYFGSQEERRHVRRLILQRGHEFNILLTTYHMTTGMMEDRALFKKFEFQYAVFDEGHLLKNIKSQRFQHLMKIRAERRLLLTGTPLQNNLTELMSLLCFVMPQIFQGKTEPLKRVLSATKGGEEAQSSFEKDRVAQAKRIMRPFVFRRVKSDVLSDLPKKEERVERCPMLPEQKELYDRLVSQFSSELESRISGNGGGPGMFMQLRKAANHPLLLLDHYTAKKRKAIAAGLMKEPSYQERGALQELVEEDLAVLHDYEIHQLCLRHKTYIGKYALSPEKIVSSGKFKVLDNLLKDYKAKGNRVLLFSQFTIMLDIIEEYFRIRGHRFVRLDGATRVEERQPLIDKFTKDKGIFVFMLSTRAGGMGINLTAADVVIIHDIDFNPYNDKQAEDRCHRMGQEKKVQIVRLISKDTMEEAMLRRAQYKLKLERDVTGNHEDNDEEKSMDVVCLLKEALAAKERSMDGKAPAAASSSTPDS